MKKLIATLALVGMSTLAFGQNLVLSGYLDSGVTVMANGVDKAVLGLWGEDAGVNGGRVKLIGKYDNGDFGASFETRWDNLIGTNDLSKYLLGGNDTKANAVHDTPIPVYFKHAYAQAQFFDKMILTQVGMVKEESTKTGGNKNFKYASEVAGAVVVVKPIADLAIQAFLAPAIGKDAKLADNVSNFVDTQTAISAAYTLKGIARVAAGAKLYSSLYNGYVPTAAYAGVNLYVVPNLTATVEGALETLNTGKLEGITTVAETVSYNFKDLGMAPLTVGLVAYQYLYGDDVRTKDASSAAVAGTVKQDMALRIQPSVSYAFDNGITANLGAAYQSGAVVVTDGYTSDLGKTVGVPMYSPKKNPNKIATFELKPSVKLTLTKTQALSFIYAYATSIGEDSVNFITNKATNMQTFQAAYTYSF